MEYGLIVFKNTKNLGDDIQSYSIKCLLPKVDYYIEREEINEFVSDSREKVKTVLGGWYNHSDYSFPPSPYIEPLFISIHLTNRLKDELPCYFTDYFLSYLKKYEPIGLRDGVVKKYLDDARIKNYFSGCSTLTLKKFENVEKTDKICVVDLDYFTTANIKANFDNVISVTHNVDENYDNLSYEERFEFVEERLKLYQASKCVITSRLHCALPCLALGVPVLLVYNGENIDVKNRLSNYTNFLNYVSKDELNENCKELISSLNNNRYDFKPFRENLYLEVQKFIEKDIDTKVEVDLFNYFIEQKRNIQKISEIKINSIVSESELRYNLLKEAEKRYYRLELINEGINKELELVKEKSKNIFDGYNDLTNKYNELLDEKRKLDNDFYITNDMLYRIQNSKPYKISLLLAKPINWLRSIKKFRR